MDVYSANEIIELAVLIEESGYEYYKQALKRKELDLETKNLLEFLCDQEKKHKDLFLKMRDKEDIIDLESSNSWEEVSSFLKTIVNCKLFSNPDMAIIKAKESNTKKELLQHALQFEKDTLLYYHSICRLVSDEHIKDIMEKIIVEEMSHIVKLALFIDKNRN